VSLLFGGAASFELARARFKLSDGEAERTSRVIGELLTLGLRVGFSNDFDLAGTSCLSRLACGDSGNWLVFGRGVDSVRVDIGAFPSRDLPPELENRTVWLQERPTFYFDLEALELAGQDQL
jgi:hypothetical protein